MGVHVFLVHTVCVVRGHGQTRKGECNLLSRASIWILPCTRRGWQQLVILSPYHTKPSSFRHNLPQVEIKYTNNTYKMTTRCVFIPLCSSLHHQGLCQSQKYWPEEVGQCQRHKIWRPLNQNGPTKDKMTQLAIRNFWKTHRNDRILQYHESPETMSSTLFGTCTKCKLQSKVQFRYRNVSYLSCT